MDEPTGNPARQIYMFREFFESKSLENDYLITIEDDAAGYGAPSKPTKWYGSISQMSFAISGSSPIVWRARIQFFVGNVITVFDSDSPESPQSLSANYRTGNADTMTLGDRDIIKVRFKDPSSFGATDANEAEIMYRQEGKLNWTSVKYNIQTNTGASQSVNALTKVNNVLNPDHDYYVVYLPAAVEGTAGADNYNLTSSGLWNYTAYPSATTFTLGEDAGEYYTVKVHFRNTSGDGGFSSDTVELAPE